MKQLGLYHAIQSFNNIDEETFENTLEKAEITGNCFLLPKMSSSLAKAVITFIALFHLSTANIKLFTTQQNFRLIQNEIMCIRQKKHD